MAPSDICNVCVRSGIRTVIGIAACQLAGSFKKRRKAGDNSSRLRDYFIVSRVNQGMLLFLLI